MDLSKETIHKLRGLIIFTTLIIVCLWKSDMVLGVLKQGFNIVLPFLLGAAIAFIINVPMSFIEKNIYKRVKFKKSTVDKFARVSALILTLIFIVGIVAIVFLVVVPQLSITVASLGVSVQKFIPQLADIATNVFVSNPEIAEFILSFEYDWDKIVSLVFNFIQAGAGNVFDTTLMIAVSLVSICTTGIIALIFSIYIVLQKETLGMQFRKICFAFMRKGRAEATLEVCALTYRSFSNFLTGQCLEAVILGTIIVIALSIFKIPFALLIGVLVAFTALIPIFGAFLGCVLGSFLIFIEDPMKALTFVIIFLVIQQIEGNLIYPHVVGGSVGLPSIWVLAAVSVGASLMGVVGMLIFIPITSVLYALFREVVYIKLQKNEIDPLDIEERRIG